MSHDVICKVEDCDNVIPELAIKHGDPFCSTGCAKKFHNVEFKIDERNTTAGVVRGSRTTAPHGTRRKYISGCSCEACKDANLVYSKQQYARRKALNANRSDGS